MHDTICKGLLPAELVSVEAVTLHYDCRTRIAQMDYSVLGTTQGYLQRQISQGRMYLLL